MRVEAFSYGWENSEQKSMDIQPENDGRRICLRAPERKAIKEKGTDSAVLA